MKGDKIMDKEAWIRKLTSRKFWATIAAFVAGLIAYIKTPSDDPTALIMAFGAVIAYVVAEGLVDAIESEHMTTSPEQPNIAERAKMGVMALLRAVGIDLEAEHPDAGEDINVRAQQMPVNASDVSKVAFKESQHAVAPTTLKPTEDPSPMAHNSEPRKQAYENDVRSIKRMFN